jgi:uncharacterized protein (TIGR03083 family)
MLDPILAIRSESTVIADLVARPGTVLDARVPSCPDWALRDLVLHIGGVQRFWAANVIAADATVPTGPEDTSTPSDAALADWMRASTDILLATLADADDSAPCWVWWGEPATVAAVARHQVQEAAVHRWDAELALGTPEPLEPAVADDGVAEFLEVMLSPGTAALRGRPPAALPGTVVLAATDTGGRWTAGGAGKGATVRATASDLVLLLYGRLPLPDVEVQGDTSLVEALLDAVRSG